MYSELVEIYSVDLFNITRKYNNGLLEDEEYYNDIKHLLKDFERKTKINEHLMYTERIYSRINHIMIVDQTPRKPGYVEGLYNSLDIIISEFERSK